MRRPKPRTEPSLLQKDTRPIRLVAHGKREFWEKIGAEPVLLMGRKNHGKRWTEEHILRIITADPEVDTYGALAEGLGRSDGAVRLIRAWAGHILRGEYEEQWRAWVESEDPKVRANKHDKILVYKVLKEHGYFDLPVTEQFRLARPLRQPRGGWRGDRTGEAIRRRNRRVAEIQARVMRMVEDSQDGR